MEKNFKFVTAFKVAEDIFFTLLTQKYIATDVQYILSRTPAFHSIEDIHALYEKRWKTIQYNDDSTIAFDNQYQLLGYRKKQRLCDYIATLIRVYPYANHRPNTLLNNLEQDDFLTHPSIFDSPLYEPSIYQKSLTEDWIERLNANKEFIGTNNQQWLSFKREFYLAFPNVLSHIDLLRHVMLVISKLHNIDSPLIQEMQPPKWKDMEHLFFEVGIDSSSSSKIMIRPYKDEFIGMLDWGRENTKTLDAVYSIMLHNNTWINDFQQSHNYYLQDIVSMMPIPNEQFYMNLKLDDLCDCQINQKDWLMALTIHDPKMNHFGSFSNSYLLPNSEYTRTFVATLYLYTVVFWYQLNWTPQEFATAQATIQDGEMAQLKDYNYFNEDGSEKGLRQIIEEQQALLKNNKSVLFGDRNNDIIKSLINISDEFVWTMSGARNQYNEIIL